MKIGNVQLENNVVLAPMAGINNQAFRLIARELGAGLVTTEMVSDKGILYRNEKTLKMLEIDPLEKPISLQIFGGEKESLVQAATYIDQHTEADIIDLNMGCPVPKVTKANAGAKLLLYPERIEEILTAIVDKVTKPVTVKMRTGWDNDHIWAEETAVRIERAGVKAIAVHGRTREQQYSGKADWAIIKKVKEAVNIPVIGNGDIFSPQDAKKMIEETNVDGVMVGRAALGNPWILYQIAEYLKTGNLIPEPNISEKLKLIYLHLDRLTALKGEEIAVKEMRKHITWYLKGLPNSTVIKEKVFEISEADKLRKLLEDYLSPENLTDTEGVSLPL